MLLHFTVGVRFSSQTRFIFEEKKIQIEKKYGNRNRYRRKQHLLLIKLYILIL